MLPGLGDEDTELAATVPLRMLLGAATVLLLVATSGALLWGLSTGTASGAAGLFIVVLTLGGCAAALFLGAALTLPQLRWIERVVFGTVTAYLGWTMYVSLTVHLALDTPATAELAWNTGITQFALLIVAYGTLVSNEWPRAARGVALIAATPLAIGALAGYRPFVGASGVLLAAAVLAVLAATVISQYLSLARSTRITLRYELKKRIGLGGMGEVWLAEHNLLARKAAVKLIRPETLGGRNAERADLVLRRFEREARATAGLRSPHTVEVYDFGHAADGTFYYAMEYLEGFDLRNLVEEHGPVPPARVVHLLRQACDSLADAHTTGLLHRDIKPANIYACRMGTAVDFVKVLDFGLVTDANLPSAMGEAATGLTIEGEINGTPGYMAPELVQAANTADGRADIYALGCVGYYLLTGTTLFEGPPLNVLMDHIQTEPEPPSARADAIPDDLERVILRCLAKNPDDRYGDVEQLGVALASCCLEPPWDHAARTDWWARHRPASVAGASAATASPS
ncbi:MAG: protein kinase [Acidobacteria bacterium]|nr:protein kinase [Acidobacteriota bacterium]